MSNEMTEKPLLFHWKSLLVPVYNEPVQGASMPFHSRAQSSTWQGRSAHFLDGRHLPNECDLSGRVGFHVFGGRIAVITNFMKEIEKVSGVRKQRNLFAGIQKESSPTWFRVLCAGFTSDWPQYFRSNPIVSLGGPSSSTGFFSA
jgi:hypothetical protein